MTDFAKDKTYIFLVIVLSLLAVAIMFNLGVLNFGRYLTEEPLEIADEPSATVDEPSDTEVVSYEPSGFDCPQLQSLTDFEKEELRNKIGELILEYTESDTQPDNDILITEFPKCFSSPDS